CGGSRWTPILEAPDSAPGGTGLWFAVVQCLDCGLCFTNPRPSPETIGQFYPTAYGPHRPPSARQPSGRFRLPLPWRGPRKGHQGLRWHGQGRLLDFGCGSGSFLLRMHRQGWRVTGVDLSRAAVGHVRGELGLPALLGSLPHPDLRPASFDVITMWHSLEHVHRPMAVLEEAYRLLVPGGQLLVAVPNIESLAFRWFGSAWYALDLPRHLTHFAPWSLRMMLENVGFTVGRIRMVPHNNWLHTSAKLSAGSRGSPRWHRLFTARPLSRLATWYCYLTSQSDAMIVTAQR
ncbi:MAG TPA: class I SAM-dependent methyltransferase, partial [Gemmataceae bacterium]|nr:class I SAM-dependent methyltransferase [Gemmataceae bacterium]